MQKELQIFWNLAPMNDTDCKGKLILLDGLIERVILEFNFIDKYNIPSNLLDGIVNNQVIPFIGAGFSKNAIMPEGRTMPDWNELGMVIASLMKDYQYDNAIDTFSFYEYSNSKSALIKQLRGQLIIPGMRPSQVHKTLLKLFNNSLIFTTNYDT